MWTTPTMYDTSKLTVELREIVEAGVNIWDFDYPSFYEGEAKKAFEKKVIDHYYFRQIGQETTGRWLHMFRTRMREIMPYYIQLYESEKFMQDIEDPFATVDVTETFEQTRTDEEATTGKTSDSSTNSSETSTEGSTTVDNVKKFSNTPQGTVTNIDSYLTEATVDDGGTLETGSSTSSIQTSGSGESEGTKTGTYTDKYTLTKKGAMGVTTFGHDMIEYRQSFLNIDLMVIRELNDLFLGVY